MMCGNNTCREFRMANIHAKTLVSALTDMTPITQVNPNIGNNTIVAFIMYLSTKSNIYIHKVVDKHFFT